jgi:hypothetical protein
MSQEGPELPAETWRDFFQRLSSQYRGYAVTIEAVSRDYGDQLQAEALPLAYLEYDPKDDVLIIALDSRDGRDAPVLRHMIEHPQRILADEVNDDVPWAIDAFAEDGTQTIVTLYRRPVLPPSGE